jgi:hypothetical protein
MIHLGPIFSDWSVRGNSSAHSVQDKIVCTASSTRHVAVSTTSGSLHLYAAAESQLRLLYTVPRADPNGDSRFSAMKFSFCGTYIACGTSKGDVIVFQIWNGPEVTHLKVVNSHSMHQSASVTSIGWSQDGEKVFSGCRSGKVCELSKQTASSDMGSFAFAASLFGISSNKKILADFKTEVRKVDVTSFRLENPITLIDVISTLCDSKVSICYSPRSPTMKSWSSNIGVNAFGLSRMIAGSDELSPADSDQQYLIVISQGRENSKLPADRGKGTLVSLYDYRNAVRSSVNFLSEQSLSGAPSSKMTLSEERSPTGSPSYSSFLELTPVIIGRKQLLFLAITSQYQLAIVDPLEQIFQVIRCFSYVHSISVSGSMVYVAHFVPVASALPDSPAENFQSFEFLCKASTLHRRDRSVAARVPPGGRDDNDAADTRVMMLVDAFLILPGSSGLCDDGDSSLASTEKKQRERLVVLSRRFLRLVRSMQRAFRGRRSRGRRDQDAETPARPPADSLSDSGHADALDSSPLMDPHYEGVLINESVLPASLGPARRRPTRASSERFLKMKMLSLDNGSKSARNSELFAMENRSQQRRSTRNLQGELSPKGKGGDDVLAAMNGAGAIWRDKWTKNSDGSVEQYAAEVYQKANFPLFTPVVMSSVNASSGGGVSSVKDRLLSRRAARSRRDQRVSEREIAVGSEESEDVKIDSRKPVKVEDIEDATDLLQEEYERRKTYVIRLPLYETCGTGIKFDLLQNGGLVVKGFVRPSITTGKIFIASAFLKLLQDALIYLNVRWHVVERARL